MTKPFKKLLGNRVYLNMPTIPESNIILSKEVQQSLIAAEQEKYQKLMVYAVGDIVTNITEGDKVLVDPNALQAAPVIKLSETLSVIMVSPFNIAHIWND